MLYAQGAPAGASKLPLATEAEFALSTDQILAPDRILQLDMKLRNIILVEEFLERRPWPSELPGPPSGGLDGGLQRRTAVLHATPLGGSELGDL